ncbi:MAG: TlyA family RNA methyltransferase [Magnetococcales bacterium]|nr:TlyA family RNA methyltransferase [Magnetococcales bacterium]
MRLDALLVERQLVASIQQACGYIMDGKVLVDERRLTKPGTPVRLHAVVRLLADPMPWVSRGGIKLAHAIDHFNLVVKNAVCLDVGAATGGFTDVLLQRGAARVYAMDVGYGQLAWKLVQDSRVVLLDRTNICTVDPAVIPELVDWLTMDVSFMGVDQALPAALGFLRPGGYGVILLKPQFELAREKITPGGVIWDPALHQEALTLFAQLADRLGLKVAGIIPSPVTGSKGNKEFLCCIRKITGAETQPHAC